MPSESEVRAETRAKGLRTKRTNLIVALSSGGFLVWISLRFFPHSDAGVVLGFVGGLLYANAFEYCLHRFVLHAGCGFLFKQHMLHHDTWHSPEAARYVNFSRNPLGVVGVFAANSVPFLLLQWIFRNSWTAGVFGAFALYYIAFEEIHWRSHMGGWLPKWLRFAARHHLLHHAHETGEYNVFLPLFDWLFERRQGREAAQEGNWLPAPTGLAKGYRIIFRLARCEEVRSTTSPQQVILAPHKPGRRLP